MPGLINLNTYKAASDRQLLSSFNRLVDAVEDNFDFTLASVSSPVPAIFAADIGKVLYVNVLQDLEYRSVNELVSLQQVFDTELAKGTLNTLIKNSLSLGLFKTQDSSFGVPAEGLSFAINGVRDTGVVNNYVKYLQAGTDGLITETHSVNAFSLTANTATVTVNSGYLTVNKLQVAGYTFPTVTPTEGQILQVVAGKLSFVAPLDKVAETGTVYSFVNAKPLLFQATTFAPNIQFASSATGFGYRLADSVSPHNRVFSKINSYTIFELVAPTPVGAVPHMKMSRAFVLPPISGLNTTYDPIGSLWYDEGADSLVLYGREGQRHIKGSALSTAVNTTEAKSFNLNTGATLRMGGGTAAASSLNVGDVGLSSTGSTLSINSSGTAVVTISNTAIEAANTQSSATAKVVISDQVGMNSPANPVFTFSNATGLGLYREGPDSVAISASSQAIIAFSKGKVDAKHNKIANVATPTEARDAVTKDYVDTRMPGGTVTGALPVVDSATTGKYVQSTAKYSSGTLTLGNTNTPGGMQLASSKGGKVTLKAGQNVTDIAFELPSTSGSGLLSHANGKTFWVPISTLTSGLVKTDGTTTLTKGLSWTNNTSLTAPLLKRGTAGMFMSSTTSTDIIGFLGENVLALELDATNRTLEGGAKAFNAPFINLKNTLLDYSSSAYAGNPTYSFSGEKTTGLGQPKQNTVGLMVGGVTKLSASTTSISVHSNKIQGLAEPTLSTDAATKNYVDKKSKKFLEISFRVTALPSGWSAGNPLTLDIYSATLIYGAASAGLTYESESTLSSFTVPNNFNTDPVSQVYLAGLKLAKMQNASSVREVAFGTSTSIVLNVSVSVGQILTIQLPAT